MPEPGSDWLDRVIDLVPVQRMLCLMLGASEVASVLVRRHNAGRMSDAVFVSAMPMEEQDTAWPDANSIGMPPTLRGL